MRVGISKQTFVAILALAGVLFIVSLVYTRVAVAPVVAAPSAAQIAANTVTIRGNVIRVSIADTDALRQLGLGGRAGLAPDEGMLFVFPQDGSYAFWMKDMTFPIDILWLSADKYIVDIRADVSPDTYPHAFAPITPSRYVLELPAGYTQSNGIQIGDTAAF